MGDHHRNGNAIAKRDRHPQPTFPPGVELYNFQIETALELNAEAMEIADAAVKAARARGDDERDAFTLATKDWDPKETPERFDVVAYKRWTLGRPSPLLPDPRQIPTAMIRHGELDRIPLTELQARADIAFEEAKTGGRPPQ